MSETCRPLQVVDAIAAALEHAAQGSCKHGEMAEAAGQNAATASGHISGCQWAAPAAAGVADVMAHRADWSVLQAAGVIALEVRIVLVVFWL